MGNFWNLPVAPCTFQIASLLLWQFPNLSIIGRCAVLPWKVNVTLWISGVLRSALFWDCKCLEVQNFQLEAVVPVPVPTAFAARSSAMRWEELQGMCSVHLLRLPHFLNCRLIAQADQILTGYRERIVTSKLVK